MSFSSPRFAGGFARALLPFVLFLLSLAACQQGLVPGNANDMPWSFHGVVVPSHTIPATTFNDDGGVPEETKPKMGVLWTDPLQFVSDVPQPARGIESSVENDTFQIDIYGPPPPQAMVEIPTSAGDSIRLAYGEIVMIADQNGDGTFEVSGADATIAAPDRYLAGANTVLVYLDKPYPSLPRNAFAVSADQGYQLVTYVCAHQTIQDMIAQNPNGGTVASVQPSTTFPDVRSCARTHSP
jgi:hypothetical protein